LLLAAAPPRSVRRLLQPRLHLFALRLNLQYLDIKLSSKANVTDE